MTWNEWLALKRRLDNANQTIAFYDDKTKFFLSPGGQVLVSFTDHCGKEWLYRWTLREDSSYPKKMHGWSQGGTRTGVVSWLKRYILGMPVGGIQGWVNMCNEHCKLGGDRRLELLEFVKSYWPVELIREPKIDPVDKAKAHTS